jgi:hypothetical protein
MRGITNDSPCFNNKPSSLLFREEFCLPGRAGQSKNKKNAKQTQPVPVKAGIQRYYKPLSGKEIQKLYPP